MMTLSIGRTVEHHRTGTGLRRWALLIVLLVPGANARGQDSSARVDSARPPGPARAVAPCDTILRAHRVDSVRVSVRAQILRTDGVLPPEVRALIMRELTMRLELPRPLVVPTFAPGPTQLRMLRPERETSAGEPTASLRAPSIYGVYQFRLARTGIADSLAVVIPSLTPGLDSSVVEALRRASAERAFPMFPPEIRKDTLRLQVRVMSGLEEPRLRGAWHVLFESMFPRHLVADASPWPLNPAAPYPEEERADGQDGDVLLRGVIDVDGAPVISTLEVVHATSRAFALSALRTVARWRFAPAHVGACPVPQAVHVPFWFSLRP